MARNPDALKRALLANAEAALAEWFPQGRLRGDEVMVGDLDGSPGDSLRANVKTGVWRDFASDEPGGNNLFELFLRKTGQNFEQGYDELAPRYGLNESTARTVHQGRGTNSPSQAAPTMPVPDDAPEFNPPAGAPAVYDYRDLEGRLLYYRVRTDNDDGNASPSG